MSPSEIHQKRSHLYTIQDLQDYKPPPIPHIIWDGVLDLGTRLEIFGDEGTWKSALAIHAAYCIAIGRRWLGFKTTPANVLLVQGEMSLYHTKERIEKYCAGTKQILLTTDHPLQLGDNIDMQLNSIAFPDNVVCQALEYLHLDESSGFESVKKDLMELATLYPAKPVVLIIDPLFKVFRHDLIKEDEVKYFLDNMDLLLRDRRIWQDLPGMSLILIHHARKSQLDKDGNVITSGSNDMFGSASLKWWPDTILRTSLDESDETKTTCILEFSKHSRVASGFLPKRIGLRWSKDLLHPRILYRYMPQLPEDETEDRGGLEVATYE